MSFKKKTFSTSSPARSSLSYKKHEKLCREVIVGNRKAVRQLLWFRYSYCCDGPMPTFDECKARGCKLAKQNLTTGHQRQCCDDMAATSLRKHQDAFHRSISRNVPRELFINPVQDQDAMYETFDKFWKWVLEESPITKEMGTGARRYAESRWPQIT